MAYSFSLSLAAVDILLEYSGLAGTPFPFLIPHIGTTHEQRDQVRAAVFRDLESRDLMRTGRLDADVEDALRAFVDGQVVVTAVARLEEDRELFARACAAGNYGLVVRKNENLLVFTETRPTGVVPAIVDLLPLTPAAPGQSVTIAKPATSRQGAGSHAAPDSGYDPFTSVQPPRAPANTQLRAAERLFEKPKLRIGQFTAFVRDAQGKQVQLTPFAWFDTEDGRYFATSREAADGQSWMTYVPADNARIAHQLHEQLEGYL